MDHIIPGQSGIDKTFLDRPAGRLFTESLLSRLEATATSARIVKQGPTIVSSPGRIVPLDVHLQTGG